MTDLDVQVYKELLNAEYEKLKKASIRSPDVRLSAKQDGILTAIQLLEQAEKRKRGRASAVRRKLIDKELLRKYPNVIKMYDESMVGEFAPVLDDGDLVKEQYEELSED